MTRSRVVKVTAGADAPVPGVRIAGAPSLVEEALADGARALV